MTILKQEKKNMKFKNSFDYTVLAMDSRETRRCSPLVCMHVNWIQLALQSQQHSDPDVSLIA
jgi:hypothetical protein